MPILANSGTPEFTFHNYLRLILLGLQVQSAIDTYRTLNLSLLLDL